jgi:hypothetical protein
VFHRAASFHRPGCHAAGVVPLGAAGGVDVACRSTSIGDAESSAEWRRVGLDQPLMNSKTGVRSVTRGRTIAGEGLRLIAILLTHAHVDHVSGVASAKRELKVPTWLHADDQPLYERAAAQGLLFGRWIEQPPAIDHFHAGDGTWGRFGDYEIRRCRQDGAPRERGHCQAGVGACAGQHGAHRGHVAAARPSCCASACRLGAPRATAGLAATATRHSRWAAGCAMSG